MSSYCGQFPTTALMTCNGGYGLAPFRLGIFFDFEVGGHDSIYKGRIHDIVPFIGRTWNLTALQQSYNDMCGWCRAHIEQLFGILWHWALVGNIWHGGPCELQQYARVLLHFTQFCIRRQVNHPPYGPWTMSRLMFGLIKATWPPHKMKERARHMCVPCVVRIVPLSQVVVRQEHHCAECIDAHTCGGKIDSMS